MNATPNQPMDLLSLYEVPTPLPVHDANGEEVLPRDGWRLADLPCHKADPTEFDVYWSIGTAQVENVVDKYCGRCPFRTDCVVDAIALGDTGVIRGGVQFFDARTEMKHCSQCGLPCAREELDGDPICTYCDTMLEVEA